MASRHGCGAGRALGSLVPYSGNRVAAVARTHLPFRARIVSKVSGGIGWGRSRESSGPGPVAGSPHAVLGALSRRRRSARLRRGAGMPLPAPPAGKNCSTHASTAGLPKIMPLRHTHYCGLKGRPSGVRAFAFIAGKNSGKHPRGCREMGFVPWPVLRMLGAIHSGSQYFDVRPEFIEFHRPVAAFPSLAPSALRRDLRRMCDRPTIWRGTDASLLQ